MEIDVDKALRQHLLELLSGKSAHADFETVIAGFEVNSVNRKVKGVPYTPWHVLDHMRIAQWDILEFCRNPRHVSPEWPKGYWPAEDEIASLEVWNKSIEHFRTDLKAFESIVKDSATNLFAPLAHGAGQTILREVLLVAQHNSYHLGVLVALKRILTKGAEE